MGKSRKYHQVFHVEAALKYLVVPLGTYFCPRLYLVDIVDCRGLCRGGPDANTRSLHGSLCIPLLCQSVAETAAAGRCSAQGLSQPRQPSRERLPEVTAYRAGTAGRRPVHAAGGAVLWTVDTGLGDICSRARYVCMDGGREGEGCGDEYPRSRDGQTRLAG